jgi:hypothetical protein
MIKGGSGGVKFFLKFLGKGVRRKSFCEGVVLGF